MAKFVSMKEAAELVHDGMSIMVGGFLGCGSAHSLLEYLANSEVRNLTVICNDAALQNGPDGSEYYGIAKLVANHQVKKLIATHVGLNPDVAKQMNEGSLEVALVPQGSLAEMIRAGGAGLGGVLTPTGIGTMVEDSEFSCGTVEVDGKQYLLKKPLHADIALLNGHLVDRAGNVWYKGTTRNFNQVMALASDTVIMEADQIVEIGEIEPENVMTPGILVDYVVQRTLMGASAEVPTMSGAAV